MPEPQVIAKATLAIVVLFSIGLVGFYIFSAPYGDGLEVTMEKAGVEEGEAHWTAPLDYGENYWSSLAMGIVGYALTFGLLYVLLSVMRVRNAS